MAAKPPKKVLSVLKRARQAEKKRMRNKSVTSQVKTLKKKVLAAVQNNDKDQVEVVLKNAVKAFDSAASKGVLHKNTVSRNVSRLSKMVHKVLKGGAA